MKKLLLSAVGILVLISCQSDRLDSKATSEFQPILQLSKGQTAEHFADSIRNWYFATASAGERYIFWQEKINLDIEHLALEADQRTYVLEIFQELEPEHFRNGYNPSEEITNWIIEWLGRSETYNLSETQMGQFVFSLSPAPLGPSLGLSYVDKCNCSKRSDWCDFLNEGPSSGCVAFCEEKSSRGCGTLLLYECDKDCEF